MAVAGPAWLGTFNLKTGASIGTFDAPPGSLFRGMPLIDPTPTPFTVSVVALTRDGRAIGLRPAAMMFRERPFEPLNALPGRVLRREASPLAPSLPTATPVPR